MTIRDQAPVTAVVIDAYGRAIQLIPSSIRIIRLWLIVLEVVNFVRCKAPHLAVLTIPGLAELLELAGAMYTSRSSHGRCTCIPVELSSTLPARERLANVCRCPFSIIRKQLRQRWLSSLVEIRRLAIIIAINNCKAGVVLYEALGRCNISILSLTWT